jgi:cysteine synthase A
MSVLPSVLDAIGNTPLIRLKGASEATGCTILGKAEFLNPGQSIKDRAALSIIRQAEKSGQLKPGGVIVEGTAGNTGIGLALVAQALGYRTVIVIPETQSEEKKDALRLLGAELIEVPAVPYKNPNNYVKLSGRLAAELAKGSRRISPIRSRLLKPYCWCSILLKKKVSASVARRVSTLPAPFGWQKIWDRDIPS